MVLEPFNMGIIHFPSLRALVLGPWRSFPSTPPRPTRPAPVLPGEDGGTTQSTCRS